MAPVQLAYVLISAAAGLVGAWIGAKATRRASVETFERAAAREDKAWRRALHLECVQYINLNQTDEPRKFDTGFLRDCLQHASAFSQTVLQHIIWARSNFELAEMARSRNMHDDPSSSGWTGWATRYQARAVGEIDKIENMLRPVVEAENPEVADPSETTPSVVSGLAAAVTKLRRRTTPRRG